MGIASARSKKKKSRAKARRDPHTSPVTEIPLQKSVRRMNDEEKLQALANGQITFMELEGIEKSELMGTVTRGFAFLDQGRLKEARDIFEGLVAIDPKEPYFLMASGSVAQREIRFADAEEWFTACLKIDSSNIVALTNRGEVRLHLKKAKSAARDLLKALSLDPELKQPITRRARGLINELQNALAN